MLNGTQAKDFLARWLEAASAHDINRIMSFYAADAELVSPVVVTLMSEPSGRLRGTTAIRAYYVAAMAKFPYMSMQLIDVAWGVSSITGWYVSHKGARSCGYLELDAAGNVVRHVTHYTQ